MCGFCTGRQVDRTPDPWTEARKAVVLAELWAAERAMRPARPPVNRLRRVLPATAQPATQRSGR